MMSFHELCREFCRAVPWRWHPRGPRRHLSESVCAGWAGQHQPRSAILRSISPGGHRGVFSTSRLPSWKISPKSTRLVLPKPSRLRAMLPTADLSTPLRM